MAPYNGECGGARSGTWHRGQMRSARTSLGLAVTLDGVPSLFESGTIAERQRKGWLLLVPGAANAPLDLAAAYECYYSSTRFDVEPLLVEALRVAAPSGDSPGSSWPCCGAALVGLDVTALFPAGYGLWVAGDGSLRVVPSWPAGTGQQDGLGLLRRCHHRMRPGETVLLGSERFATIANKRGVARAACRRPLRFGRLVQRLTARPGAQGPLPFATIHYPLGPAVALDQPWDRPAVLLPPRAAPARTGGFSPIWIALAITILSAVGVYAAKRPSLPEASLADTLTFFLTIDRLGQAGGSESESPPASGQ